jgi:hypothetical protein
LGEDRNASPEQANVVPGAIHRFVGVVAAHAVALRQRLAQALHSVPIDLNAERRHQVIVGDGIAIFENDLVLIRIKRSDVLLDPRHASRNVVRFLTHRLFLGENPATDECPERLVEMVRARLDKGNPGWVNRIDQVGGDGQSAVPPPAITTG